MKTLLQTHHLEHMIESARGSRVLLTAGFDGVLAPRVIHSDQARIPASIVETLNELITAGQIVAAVFSDRGMDDLQPRVPFRSVLVASNGLEISGEGIAFEHPDATARRPVIAEAAETVRAAIGQWRGARVEFRGLTAIVDFRAVDRRNHCNLTVAVRRAAARFGPAVGFRAGDCRLEIHPRVGWTRGNAAQFIRQQLEMEDAPVLCLGSAADESIFRELPGEMTVRVGPSAPTSAAYYLPDEHAVVNVSGWLHDLLGVNRAALNTTAG